MGNQLNCLAQCHASHESRQRLLALQKGALRAYPVVCALGGFFGPPRRREASWTRVPDLQLVTESRRVLLAEEAGAGAHDGVGEDPPAPQHRRAEVRVKRAQRRVGGSVLLLSCHSPVGSLLWKVHDSIKEPAKIDLSAVNVVQAQGADARRLCVTPQVAC